ncbi:hypothetical protein ACVME8_000361 [Bradyrhizobium diazoefficiens]
MTGPSCAIADVANIADASTAPIALSLTPNITLDFITRLLQSRRRYNDGIGRLRK